MKRMQLCLAVVALQLVTWQQAGGWSPEKVKHSPIPPLKQPPPQNSSYAPGGDLLTLGSFHSSVTLSTLPIKSSRAKTLDLSSRPGPPLAPSKNKTVNSGLDEIANFIDNEYMSEKARIWQSPEMQDARDIVQEFCRRSKQTSPQEGEQFLEKLSQLSAEEMSNWLERFQARRRSISRGQQVGGLARQATTRQAIDRHEATRQAVTSAANLRRLANTVAPNRYVSPQQLRALHLLEQKGALIIDTQLRYNPFEAVVDPSSPRGYARKVAAALSLPGDLPRSDPRNFIRGEEGIDFGEGANPSTAPPPAAVESAVASPAAAVPAGP